jgi:hypothetical protein
LESFDFLASPEIVKWFRPYSLEDFPFLGSHSPHSFKFPITKEEGTSVYVEIPPGPFKSQPPSVKSKTSPPYTPYFSKLPIIKSASLHVKSPSTSPKN